ncbi:MAG: hypothetical protein L6407_00540, partial [Candidatus Delongbacteria bacterium]|nr:hypothetical protein [Candidatus Delongbacteria bacterium]
MKLYHAVLILIAFLYVDNLYSQPFFEGDGCDSMGDCIENVDGFPQIPPDFDNHPGMMKNKPIRQMPEKKIEKVMNVLMTQFPEFHKKLINLKENHPQVFMRTVHKLRRFVRNEKKG